MIIFIHYKDITVQFELKAIRCNDDDDIWTLSLDVISQD